MEDVHWRECLQVTNYHLQQEKEVRLMAEHNRAPKDLKLVERLKVKKEALEQEMEGVKVLQKEVCREEVTADQLKDFQGQLKEKNSSTVEPTSQLKAQEEASKVLEKKVEGLREQMKL